MQVAGIGAQQYCLGVLIVFGLRKHIHGNPVRVSGAIADDEYLGGAGDHVYAHLSKYLAFRRGHINITRSNDFIDGGYCLGAISQGCDCLGSAYSEYAVHACNFCGGQYHIVDHTVRGRNHHNDVFYPRHFGRQCVH